MHDVNNVDIPQVKEKSLINRHIPRYLFVIGDHLEPRDKMSLKEQRGLMGGLYVGSSHNEGCPTMKRTRHMLWRAFVTPLELTAYPKAADHRAEQKRDETFMDTGAVAMRAYTVYPGDDVTYMQSDRFRPMGVVELTSLAGKRWIEDHDYIEQVQNHFFPDMPAWFAGEKMPALLSDYEAMVQKGLNDPYDETFISIGEEMLESARLFRNFALGHIERNRQLILSLRSSNSGGFHYGWNERSRLYARQLNIALEDENQIKGEASSTEDTKALLEEMRKDRELRLRELELREKELEARLGTSSRNVVELPEEKPRTRRAKE